MKCPVTVAKRLMLYFSLLVQVFELFYFGLCKSLSSFILACVSQVTGLLPKLFALQMQYCTSCKVSCKFTKCTCYVQQLTITNHAYAKSVLRSLHSIAQRTISIF